MGMEGKEVKSKVSLIEVSKKSIKCLVSITMIILLLSSIFTLSSSAKGSSDDLLQTENSPPKASFTHSPNNIKTFDVIHFEDNSSDDGEIISWRWDFGDGTTSNNPDPTHRYEDDGLYDVKLTVKDDSKATDTFTKNIPVSNQKPKVDFSISDKNPLTEELINFTFESEDTDGTIKSVHWDFGDGSESYLRNTSHSYTDEGTTNVTLSVKDDDNSVNNKTQRVMIQNREPSVDFSFTPKRPYTGDEINFTSDCSDTDGKVRSYIWRFGDGGGSSGKTVDHTFEENGDYHVTLEIMDDDNDSASVTKKIEVLNRKPECNFSFSPETPTTADSVNFDDLSFDKDGQITDWRWDFGDGNQSQDKDPSHRYSDDGNYLVSLTVTDDDGKNSTIDKKIRIKNQPPTADFTYSPSKPKTEDVINFKDISKDDDGEISSWSWDFGDGHTSKNPSPTHRYTENGDYTVVLTVIDDDGSSDSCRKNISVKNTPPESDFTFTPSLPYSGELIKFEDESIDPDGELMKYSWNFGDGSGSDKRDPTHRYKKAGKYDVVLTVEDDDGATKTISKTIDVMNEKPIANFSVSDDTVKTYENIEFFDNSSDPDGTISSWNWEFGDGHTSNVIDPIHSFSDDGFYNVKLVVEDKDGKTSECNKTILVQNRAPKIDLSISPIDPQAGDVVEFESEAKDRDGRIVSWHWDFGDGNGSLNQNPTYIYKEDGTYNISFKIIDDDGISSEKSMKIKVKNSLPKAKFDHWPKEPCTSTNITFDDMSRDRDGEIIDIRWDFGDGHTSNLSTPIHSYEQDGEYEVTLTVTDDDDQSNTIMKAIHVRNRPPSANFTLSKKRYESGDEVKFIDNSDDVDGEIIKCHWEFGDGNHTTSVNPTHTYIKNKTYNVTLKVIDDDGASSNISKFITIKNRAPIADFSFNSTKHKTLEVINFTDRSTDLDGEIVNWYWNFGDGNESTHPYPTHFYSDEGIYKINLTVFDDMGDRSSICKEVEIENRRPTVNFTWKPSVPKKNTRINFLDDSVDLDGSIEEVCWDFGDGYDSKERNPTHVYDRTGTYSVRLKVSDEDNYSAFLNRTINIGNIGPKIENTKVTPKDGNTSSIYNFTLNYIDENGDEPEFVRIMIDGIEHEMKGYNNSDYKKGRLYQYSCKLSKGDHTYHFETSDGFDEIRSPVEGDYEIKNVKKTLDVSIKSPKDSKILTDEKIEIDWEGIDEISGIDHYNIKIDDSGWMYIKNKTSYNCELKDGKHVVEVRATNNEGKTSIDQKTFFVNSRIDYLNISISDQDDITQAQKIKLQITAQDEFSEVVEMRISDDRDLLESDTDWIILDDITHYTLTDEEGKHNIYLQVRTEKGFISRTVKDSIILDKSSPTGSLSVYKNKTDNRTITLNLSADDNFAEIEKVEISQNSDFKDPKIFDYTEKLQFTIDEQYGIQKIYARYITKDGQVSKIYESKVFYDDEGPKLECCKIPEKITDPNNLTQTIKWNFSDDSGIDRYKIYTGGTDNNLSLYLENQTDTSINYTFTDNRTETLKIAAVDDLGNRNSFIEKTEVDVNHPPVIIPKDIPEETTVGEISFSVIADDCKDENLNVGWFIEDEKIGSGNEITTDLDKGEHILEVRVTDSKHEVSKYYSVSVKKEDDSITSGVPVSILCIIAVILTAGIGSGLYYRFFYVSEDGSERNELTPKMAVKECLMDSDELTISEIQDILKKDTEIDVEEEEISQICRDFVINEEVSKKPYMEGEDTYRWLDPQT